VKFYLPLLRKPVQNKGQKKNNVHVSLPECRRKKQCKDGLTVYKALRNVAKLEHFGTMTQMKNT
jgi:hypothetical protein